MEIKRRYNEWLNCVTDEALREELLSLTEEEIRLRFYKELAFGTGGLRGVLGVGTACLNIYTVSRITNGVANYISLFFFLISSIRCWFATFILPAV